MGPLILNVDDLEPQRYARSSVLRSAGFDVIEAATGPEAVALARERRPDLVLLDGHLPDIDGLAICRQIKGDLSIARRTFVLHVSGTFRDAASRTAALNNGADGCLAEPVDPDELVAQVSALLRLGAAVEPASDARNAVEGERAQLEAVYNAMTDGVTVFDMTGRVVMMNDAIARFCGYASAAEMRADARCLDLPFELEELNGAPVPRDEWPVSRVLRGESFSDWELRARRADTGQEWVISYGGRPVCDARGRQTLALIVSRDVTAQKRVEASLRESEDRYRRLFDHMSEGFFLAEVICDDAGVPVDYRYLDVNRAFAPLTALPPAAVVGRTVREVLDGAEDAWIQSYGRVALTGRPMRVEGFSAPLGRYYDTVAFSPKPGQFACLFTDVTERKRREDEIKAQNELLSAITDNIPVLLAIWDPALNSFRFNKQLRQTLGWTEADAADGRFMERVYPDPDYRTYVSEFMLSLEPGWRDLKTTAKDGTALDISWANVNLSSGTSVGIGVEVGERKRLEARLQETVAELEARVRQLAESEAQYRTMGETLPYGVWRCAPDGGAEYFSDSFLELLNMTDDEIRQFGWTDRLVPEDVEPMMKRWLHCVATGEMWDGEHRVIDRHGKVRTVLSRGLPVRNDEGEISCWVGVNLDITARKQMEEDLRRANRIKDDFLATLSHELRTPLTAVLGWSHLLERGGLDEATTRQALRAIARNADAQRQLVTDVLDVSRMMSGKLRLEVAEVDVTEVLSRALLSVQPALDAKGIRLDVSADVPSAVVSADPDRLHQVFSNLLSNAAKFTPEGGRISVRVERGDAALNIVVADTGIGIAPAFLPHVFDRFAQADTSMSRRQGGLGLGLSIVRQLAELHGGRVFAASEGEGKGATFTVCLPFRAVRNHELEALKPPEEPAGVGPAADLRGLRVLIVDDLDDARTLVSTLIERAGGRPFPAASGSDALAGLALAQPDLILADLGMPEMDGYEFLERLRALPPEAGGRIPVIALTAYGSVTDRENTLAAGFAEHLTKPVLPDDLLGVVSRILAGRPRTTMS